MGILFCTVRTPCWRLPNISAGGWTPLALQFFLRARGVAQWNCAAEIWPHPSATPLGVGGLSSLQSVAITKAALEKAFAEASATYLLKAGFFLLIV